MSIIKSIIEKMKIKELFAIIFIAALAITFSPSENIYKLKIEKFRNEYQEYISICIIVIGAYYCLGIISYIKK